jgi:hypothetical protein
MYLEVLVNLTVGNSLIDLIAFIDLVDLVELGNMIVVVSLTVRIELMD